MKILFVCTGNICRSPMAQVIFSNLCKRNGRKDIIIKGAGTGAFEGQEITTDALRALKICGERLPRKPLRASVFNALMLRAYDLIITMTSAHADFIGRHPNVKSLDEFTGCGDIEDPYLYPIDVYVSVCRKLQEALPVLYKEVVK